jgi:hypothetical protein
MANVAINAFSLRPFQPFRSLGLRASGPEGSGSKCATWHEATWRVATPSPQQRCFDPTSVRDFCQAQAIDSVNASSTCIALSGS